MGKQYVVKFSAVGEHREGTVLDASDAHYKDYDWPWLLKNGAVAEYSATERTAAEKAATEQGGAAQSEAMARETKAPILAPDAPELTTGQPGGAPLSPAPKARP